MKATGIPFLAGTGFKGALRDRLSGTLETAVHRTVFGPDTGENPSEHAGAVAFGDARLLALPVRSLRGTFAWVTSPLLLRLARRDNISSDPPDIPAMRRVGKAAVTEDTVLCASGATKVFLEDLDLEITKDKADGWAQVLASLVFRGDESFLTRRFLIVDDEAMTFLWETATQVDARVKLTEAGVVRDGALWYEESLPAETLLLGLAAADRPRRVGREETAEELLDLCLGEFQHGMQFGGKANVGRGRARVIPVGLGVTP